MYLENGYDILFCHYAFILLANIHEPESHKCCHES